MRYAEVIRTLSRMQLAPASAYAGYLALTGIPLLLALPSSARVDALLEPRLDMLPIFTTVTVLLFAVYSVNFGIDHAKIRNSRGEILLRLPLSVGLLLVLSLPYWAVFEGISRQAVGRIVGILGYMLLYGMCWAWIGMLIGMRWVEEVTQFVIKYALLGGSVIMTFFVARPLNPFLALSLWLGEGQLAQGWGLLVLGYLGLFTLDGALFWWTAARLSKRDQNFY